MVGLIIRRLDDEVVPQHKLLAFLSEDGHAREKVERSFQPTFSLVLVPAEEVLELCIRRIMSQYEPIRLHLYLQ